jgi:hypothetical protein
VNGCHEKLTQGRPSRNENGGVARPTHTMKMKCGKAGQASLHRELPMTIRPQREEVWKVGHACIYFLAVKHTKRQARSSSRKAAAVQCRPSRCKSSYPTIKPLRSCFSSHMLALLVVYAVPANPAQPRSTFSL